MKNKVFPLSILCCCFIFIATFTNAEAQNINIDFMNVDGTPSNTYGAASAQAGVWNTITGLSGSNLQDITGATTAVGVTVTAGTINASGGTCAGDAGALLNDFFYTVYGTWQVVLNGLSNGNYTVYLYAPSSLQVASGNMVINGISGSSITGNDCAMTDGTTYKAVQVTVTNGTITMSGDYSGTGFNYAGLAGIQIIRQADPSAIPSLNEWGIIIFIVLAGLGAVYFMRRQTAKS